MNKLLQYHIQVNATLETTFKQLRRQLLSWSKTRAVPELDARTQYDTGLNDCRPSPKSLLSMQKGEAARLEAMKYRSI